MSEMTLTLSSPITEEQFDAITDVGFDNTNRIWFHTKHGKDVEFVKRKRGKWIYNRLHGTVRIWRCSECGWNDLSQFNFCSHCGADMRGEKDG